MKLLLTTTIGLLALAITASQAASSSWTLAGVGSWNTSGNWTNGIPDGLNDVATFASLTATAASVISQNITAGITLGGIDRTSTNTGAVTISGSPITLASSSTPFINNTGGSNLAINCNLSGTQGFITNQTQQITLGGMNSNLSGPITFNNTGSANSNVTVNTNTALGTYTLGTDPVSYGVVTLNAGSMVLGSGVTIAGRTLLVAGTRVAHNTLYVPIATTNTVNVSKWDGPIIFDRANNYTATGPGTFSKNASTANTQIGISVLELTGVISSALSDQGTIVRYGTGNGAGAILFKLTQSNTHSNKTELIQGTNSNTASFGSVIALSLGSNQAFGTSNIIEVGGSAGSQSANITAFFSSSSADRTLSETWTWYTNKIHESVADKAYQTMAFGAMPIAWDNTAGAGLYTVVDYAKVLSDTGNSGYVGSGNMKLTGNFTITTAATNTTNLSMLVGPYAGDSTFTLTLDGILARSGTLDSTKDAASSIINKQGTGTLILTNENNRYTGLFNLLAGTMLVNGKHAGAVTVGENAFLGGSGLVSGNVSIATAGGFTFGSTTLGQSFANELTLAGSLTLANNWTLTLDIDPSWEIGGETFLVACTNITGGVWDASTIINLTGIDTPLALDFRTDGLYLVGLNSVIPEPAAFALLGVSLLVVTVLRRRKN